MGIITGYISVALFLLLCAKYITKRINRPSADALFCRIHKPASGLFLMFCILHIWFVIPVLDKRNIMVICSGIAIISMAVVLIVLCHRIKDMEKKMVWHRILSIIVLAALLIHIAVYFMDFTAYQKNIRGIEITEMDLSNIPDGEYIGEYDAGYIYAKVQVAIESGRITDIKILEHKHERGQEAEKITDAIVREQSLDVDAVSGATNSGLVIKKACEDALSK